MLLLPTPTDIRRIENHRVFGPGWVLFFYGNHDVLGYVWDKPYDYCVGWL